FAELSDCAALSLPDGWRADDLPFCITLLAPAWQVSALSEPNHRGPSHEPRYLRATGEDCKPSTAGTEVPPGYTRVAVVGAHLRGMPLNGQLTERHAHFVEQTFTASHYRLYALPGTTPPKPGLVRSSQGASIALELWDIPTH